MDPGLVYDLTTTDYLNFLCGLGYNSTQLAEFSSYSCPSKPPRIKDLNYPSITIPDLSSSTKVTRVVKNVGSPGTYPVGVIEPRGISVTVSPANLTFDEVGEEKKFEVTLKKKMKEGESSAEYAFGRLIWTDRKHYVRTPLPGHPVPPMIGVPPGVPYQAYQNLYQQQQQQQLQMFWADQYREIEQTTDFRNHSLPLARIKKIMKADEDVRMIAAEAPVVFARACEMFILELTHRSWAHAEENKRRTLQKNDIAAAISRTDVFDFLIDIVPREEGKEDVAHALGGPPVDPLSYYYVKSNMHEIPFCHQELGCISGEQRKLVAWATDQFDGSRIESRKTVLPVEPNRVGLVLLRLIAEGVISSFLVAGDRRSKSILRHHGRLIYFFALTPPVSEIAAF
ncbi:hypothetical protein GW17_00020097 [Ensete ventricosum]|nr:hypothetical protein GW17_00020097 [Ensete ventricosum]